MLFGRLRALVLHEMQHADADMALQSARLTRAESDSSVYNERPSEFGDPRGSYLVQQSMETDEDTDDEAMASGDSASGGGAANDSSRNTLKQLVKGRLGDYVYPSDAPSADWELSARRRVLIANSRYKCVAIVHLKALTLLYSALISLLLAVHSRTRVRGEFRVCCSPTWRKKAPSGSSIGA